MAWSYLSTLTKDVVEAAVKLKDTVVEATQDFEREQKTFVEQKAAHERTNNRVGNEAVPPWEGLHNADELRTQIVALSADKRNFLIDPPNGTDFAFDMGVMFPIAKTVMKVDARLADMRFQLVPKQINEPTFWRNYFYRVSLIKQSAQLGMQLRVPTSGSSTNDESMSPTPDTATSSAILMTSVDKPEHNASPSLVKAAVVAPDEPEFVSDSVMHTQATTVTPKDVHRGTLADDFERLDMDSGAIGKAVAPAGNKHVDEITTNEQQSMGNDDDDDDEFDLEKELENELKDYQASHDGHGSAENDDEEVLL